MSSIVCSIVSSVAKFEGLICHAIQQAGLQNKYSQYYLLLLILHYIMCFLASLHPDL